MVTDGSSFIKDGIRYEGAAVTIEEAVIWAEALPLGPEGQDDSSNKGTAV